MNKNITILSGFSLAMLGCGSDKSLTPCNSDIEVGIFEPVDFEIYPQGFPFQLKAIVRDKCGYPLDETSFTLSSNLQEQIVIDYTLEENEIVVNPMEQLQIGEHLLSLGAINGASGNSGSDTVNLNVIENLPPSIQMDYPQANGAVFQTSEPMLVQVSVFDEQEDLDTLRLRWTIDGQIVNAPENPDTFGSGIYTPTGLSNGCHTVEVTVLDSMDQSASASADFVVYTDDAELEAYVYLEDLDGDGWGSPQSDIISCTPIDEGVPFTVLTDCDDSNPDIHPTHPDYCGDGVDSDCEPSTPLNCYPLGNLNSSNADITIDNPVIIKDVHFESQTIEGIYDVNEDSYDDMMIGFEKSAPNSSFPFLKKANGLIYFIEGPLIGSISDLSTDTNVISCNWYGVL